METAGDWDSGPDTGMSPSETHNQAQHKEEELGWGSDVEHSCYQSASPSSSHILAGYNAEENCVDFLQVEPEKSVNVSINWESLNLTSLVWMVVIKVFDLAFSLYIVGLICYCIYINSNVLLSKISLPSNTSNIDMDWLDHNITVLGRSQWTMSPNHFTLIFSIFHIVYGVIAIICDLIFFQSMFKKMIKTRYIDTVLPVHRLFFVVISGFDGIMFASSTNITILVGDVFAVILIILISILVLVDTFMILLSFKAVNGKTALVFSRPWRNLVMMTVIILTTLYAVASQHPLYTWDVGPSLGWGVLSILVILKCLVDTTMCKTTEPSPPEENVLHFLMCISSSNVLGLCSVGAVAHSLIFDYYRTIFDHL